MPLYSLCKLGLNWEIHSCFQHLIIKWFRWFAVWLCRSSDNDVRNLSHDIYGLLANNPEAKLEMQRQLRAHIDGD